MQGLFKGLIPALLNIALPSTCPICQRHTDNYLRAPFCLDCWSTIMPYDGPACMLCAAQLGSAHAKVCAECERRRPVFSRALAFGNYSGALKEAIGLLKFSGIRRLAGPLGRLLSMLDLPQADVIVPVPLDRESLKSRGFNQTLLIGRSLSNHINVPLGIGVLQKVKSTAPQVGLSREERLSNIKGAFSAKRPVKGKRILLIDDVMTTGATASECSRALYEAGADSVIVAVLARA